VSVAIEDIRRAAAMLDGHVVRTPMVASRTLSEVLGAEILLKLENLQFTASFKDRGAWVKLQSLSVDERCRGVVAISAGNHAQAVAYHAQRLGIPAVILMPEPTPQVKVQHTRNFGAEVILAGETLTETGAHAEAIMQARGLVPVHPYDDDAVIAGQGTVGLEMCEAAPDLDCIVAPVGGGGLIAGVSVAAHALSPRMKVYGVEAALYPSMHNAVHGAQAPCAGDTIAEGIAVKKPGARTLPIVRGHVEEIILIPESELEHAIALLLMVEKTLGEGAGAAGLAAVAARPDLFAGRKVGIIISGGNIDARLLANVLLREQVRAGRLIVLRVELSDRPGSLARIVRLIGDAGGNIIDVTHSRMLTSVVAKRVGVTFTIETRDSDHSEDILQRLREADLNVRRVEAQG
jgi:threonine dehydratase